MKIFLRMAVAGLVLTPWGAARCDQPVLKTNGFVDVFNQAAANDHVDKVAKFEKCKGGLTPGCRYRISEHTIVVVSGRGPDAPARRVAVLTTPDSQPIKDLFAAEDAAVWPVVIGILNPELTADDRAEMIGKFTAVLKDDRSTFTTKVGDNRYSAAASRDMGIWIVANIKPATAAEDATWIARWRQRLSAWIKGRHTAPTESQ